VLTTEREPFITTAVANEKIVESPAVDESEVVRMIVDAPSAVDLRRASGSSKIR
jgi:hypothetical protein